MEKICVREVSFGRELWSCELNVDEFPYIVHPGKQKEICQFVCAATSEVATVTPILHDETFEKQLSLWIRKMANY